MQKQYITMGVLAVSLLGGVLVGQPAEAAESCTPTVTIKSVKKTSITLKVMCPKNIYANQKAKVRIGVTNVDKDKETKTTYSTTFNSEGVASVKIANLEAGKDYSFTTQAKKRYALMYGTSSSALVQATKGSSYDVDLEKINGVSENQATIHFSSNDLENKAVNVEISYKKKKTWTTVTKSLTLDGDGDGSVVLTGLNDDTKYTVKVRVKKTTDMYYTRYTDTKTFTTDSN